MARDGKVVHFLLIGSTSWPPSSESTRYCAWQLPMASRMKLGKAVFESRQRMPMIRAADLVAHLFYSIRTRTRISAERLYATGKLATRWDKGKLALVDAAGTEDFLGSLPPGSRKQLKAMQPRRSLETKRRGTGGDKQVSDAGSADGRGFCVGTASEGALPPSWTFPTPVSPWGSVHEHRLLRTHVGRTASSSTGPKQRRRDVRRRARSRDQPDACPPRLAPTHHMGHMTEVQAERAVGTRRGPATMGEMFRAMGEG